MLLKIKITRGAHLVAVLATGIILTAMLNLRVWAQEQGKDNLPRGRTPAAIIDGQYPDSYFPNTELLGAEEMRITALGTGMPNQTKAAGRLFWLGTGPGNLCVDTNPYRASSFWTGHVRG